MDVIRSESDDGERGGRWTARMARGTAPSMFRRARHPVFELGPDGIATPLNAAARAFAPRPGPLESVFPGRLLGGQGGTYRLGRMAEEAGYARASLAGVEGYAELSVESLGGARQLWRLLPAPPAPGPDGEALDRRAAIDAALGLLPVAVARLDAAGLLIFVNAAAQRLLGAGAQPGVAAETLIEGLGKPMRERVAQTLAGRAQGRSEVARCKGRDGFLQVTMTRMEGETGAELVMVLSDATELKTLEAQFVQSQKMQAVGQLAGGIAHDFNNLLTAINGHCDLLLLRHAQGDAEHSDLMQIRQNANRAAALVRQLLAFSRKQTLRPQVLHLFDTLAELANLLNRLLGEKVKLCIENSEDIWPVRVDERQLEQVIVNLVVNSRDAMPTGGVVSLRTSNVTLSEPLERDRATVPPGNYSVIEVEDTGTGIPRETLSKVFEPFFTTKKLGEGTGLGLSTAYGIIKQMDGFIFVDSTVGKGTLFRVYLPAHSPEEDADAPLVSPPPEPRRFRDPTGRGVVLLVEDEAPVRAFAARALRMRGYTVLEADSGETALEMLEDRELRVDLFVSDVVMPGVDGPSWVRRAYATRPEASTVFVSGYSEDAFSEGRAAVPRSSYLPKPFSLNDLVERVREHMDRYVN